MPTLQGILSNDYHLMSGAVLLVTVALSAWFVRYFAHHDGSGRETQRRR